MQWIPPELRENRGELEAARKGELPELIEVGDLRGELHCHTVASDGRNTIEEMAHAALERGYEYIAFTDHSASHGFGNDVPPDELRRQIERIREADERIDGITPARRLGGEHPPRRLARLRGRPAGASSTGSWPACTPRSARREGADRADDRGDGAPAGRRDRPPDRPSDRAPRALPARHRRGGRGRRAHRHVPRDQRQPRPPRPERDQRPARRGPGGDAGDRLRRARGRDAAQRASTAWRRRGGRGSRRPTWRTRGRWRS